MSECVLGSLEFPQSSLGVRVISSSYLKVPIEVNGWLVLCSDAGSRGWEFTHAGFTTCSTSSHEAGCVSELYTCIPKCITVYGIREILHSLHLHNYVSLLLPGRKPTKYFDLYKVFLCSALRNNKISVDRTCTWPVQNCTRVVILKKMQRRIS